VTFQVSFLEWLQTGQFGPIAAGMPTQEVFERLGYPDDLARYRNMVCQGRKRCQYPDALVFGDVQLMFQHPHHDLYILQLDYPFTHTVPADDEGIAESPLDAHGTAMQRAAITGDDLFDIDPWALQPDVSFDDMIMRLRGADITVTQYFPPWADRDGTARLVAGAGIDLIYTLEGGRVGLSSIYQLAGGSSLPHIRQAREPRRF
jgi:hypothetical protein